jgi:adenosylmethionine-8-amino-7-oxononanoate aminotransferase
LCSYHLQLTLSGSEAIEAFQKLSLQYHAKEKPNPEKSRTIFIARERSYHGATLNALGVSGYISRRQIFEPVLPKNMEFISACNPYRDMTDGMTTQQYIEKLAKELEDKILELGPENVAGYLFEPVVGAVSNCRSTL